MKQERKWDHFTTSSVFKRTLSVSWIHNKIISLFKTLEASKERKIVEKVSALA